LKELRLLHLRLPDTEALGPTISTHHAALASVAVQVFASRLLGDLSRRTHESQNPSKLNALVLGHVAGLRQPHPDRVSPLQQRDFIRGAQKAALGQTTAVGVPITRGMLQDSHPYTDILDVDFGAESPFERCASRAV
jgi:hypothetical protein